MQSILTSWKEIGQYLGKGVRTVQRWESEYGLPVRRATSSSHHAVLAIPQEIDAWVQRQTKDRRSELDCLRNEVQALREENAILRHHLAATAAEAQQNAQLRDRNPVGPVIDRDVLWQASRRSHLVLETPKRGSEGISHDATVLDARSSVGS